MADPNTTAAWLRDQGQERPDACIQERDWCSKMNAAADEIERLRDLLRRWVELDGDRDDIAKLIGETYAEVKLLHA